MQKQLFDNQTAEYEFGDSKKLSDQSEIQEQQKNIKVVAERFSPRGVKIAQRESLMWGTARLQAIEFGNVMHEILSFIKTENDISLALIMAIEDGLIVRSQKDEVEKTLKAVIFHPELNVFFAEGNTIYNEQSIIRHEVQTIKPDRVAINGTTALLLDYKTGVHQAKYAAQLASYQLALEEMGLQVVKKTLVYIGEDINVVNLP